MYGSSTALRIDLNRDGTVCGMVAFFTMWRFFRAAGIGRGNPGPHLHPFSPSGRVRAQPAVAGAIRGQLVTANRQDRLHKRHLSTEYMQFRAAAGLAGPIRAGGPSGAVYHNQDCPEKGPCRKSCTAKHNLFVVS